MSTTQIEFRKLSDKFERLVVSVEKCEDPQKRLDLLELMKALIDEMEDVVVTSTEDDISTPLGHAKPYVPKPDGA